jgi:hypothetical protein
MTPDSPQGRWLGSSLCLSILLPLFVIGRGIGGHKRVSIPVPLGSSSDTGRTRPYTIGGPTDVEDAWSMYPCTTPLMQEPREEIMGLADRLGPL